MRIRQKLFYSLVTVITVGVFLELGARRLAPEGERPDPLQAVGLPGWANARVYDPLLFWRLQPNPPLINALGLRGELPGAKGDRFRILSLGESSTFAARVERPYSSLLADLLGTVEGRPVQVINAGIPGYTLVQGYAYLKYHGLALEPDAVMIYFGLNDSLPVAFRSERTGLLEAGEEGLTDRELFEERRRIGARAADLAYRYSGLFRVMMTAAYGDRRAGWLPVADPDAQEAAVAPGSVQRDETRQRVPESDRLAILGELRDLCRDQGIRLVVLVPWYSAYRDHAALLRSFALENDLPLVDLPKRLDGLAEPRVSFFSDRIHPNGAGHREIARAIGEDLRAIWPR